MLQKALTESLGENVVQCALGKVTLIPYSFPIDGCVVKIARSSSLKNSWYPSKITHIGSELPGLLVWTLVVRIICGMSPSVVSTSPTEPVCYITLTMDG